MTSTIFIENMRLHAYHGVMEQERTVGNDYVITVRIGYPIEKAMASDRVEDTLNYAVVAEVIKQEMAIPSSLIEHVVGRISETLKTRFPEIQSINIRMKKVAPPMSIDCDGAGVEVQFDSGEWEREN